STRCSRSWVGLQRRLVATATRSSRCVAVWYSPRSLSASGNWTIGILRKRRRREEAVVIGQAMGRDPEVPHAGVRRQEEWDGRRGAPGAGALVEAVRDGPGTERVPGHRVGEGRVEFPGIVLVEETEQGRGVAGHEFAAASEGVEEGLGVGTRLAESVAAAQVVGA